MQNEITVSIICTAYNHENYIRKALDGFVMQRTSFRYEVLINDDASSDKTADIIREYEQKHPDIIKPIYQQENQISRGVRVTNDILIPRARGKYLAFCEGDDFWTDPDKLQRQVDFLESNPKYSACVHKYITVNKQGEKTDVKTFGYYEAEEDYTLKDFESKELPSQLASLVCRNLFQQKGTEFPSALKEIKIQGDIKIFLYLLANGDIRRMGEISSAYRFVQELGGGSWSSRALKNPSLPYLHWKSVRRIEKVFYKTYGKKINLKRRRIGLAVSTLSALKRKFNFTTLGHALHVLIAQRGLIAYLIKRKFKKK